MPLTARLGSNCRIYKNTASWASPTWVVRNDPVKEVTLNLSAGEADVSTRGGGGWKQMITTLKDASIDIQLQWDPADTFCQELLDAFTGGTSLDLKVMDGADPAAVGGTAPEGLRALFGVVSFNRSEPLEEGITVDVTIKPTTGQTPVWFTGTVST
jgi:hypothetical protein